MKRLLNLWILVAANTMMMAQGEVVFDFSTSQRGPVIGPLHYGIFYEEINHAGDGGIYAELVRNGSMEESTSNPNYWWTVGNATFSVSTQNLLNGAQKGAMRLNMTAAGDGTRNSGYWGINIVKGQTYKASFWVRTVNNWEGDLTLTLENEAGKDLGNTVVHVSDAAEWTKFTAELTATGNESIGWFALRGSQRGTIYLDCVSLFPPTFKDRENGMRRDLAEKLAALHPRFMRFPGGCYVEGGNRFQWKNTVGPVEERLGLYNSHWGYPVSNGMGFHEFLQLAEDLGAEPLFVVNVGLGHGWYQDYQHIQGFIEEALDALEYCNGGTNTYWGAKRAAAGHPEPFNLRLLEIGNENYNFHADTNEDQSDHYAERYKQFYDAIKAKYPDVICIGNVESWGTDNPTWRNAYEVEMVDEHYYRSPDWFAGNYHKYDNFSRTSHKIYNGEYAVTSDFGTNGTLKAALGEAIYMAGMERNSDVCVMASYAPIFMNENEAQWRPDMLHYNSEKSFGTPSYWTQQMMASKVGHQNLTWKESGNTVSMADNAQLGLGSWNTDATYRNIKVTNAEGTVVYTNEGPINSPASTQGISRVVDAITDNCTIELDAVKNSGSEGFLIAFAYLDNANFAWWNLGGWSNATHGIEQSVNGTKSTLTSVSGNIETGRTYHLKIEREGLVARCYMDDQLIHTVTLSSSEGHRLFLCASLNEAEDSAIVKIINYNGQTVSTCLQFGEAKVSGTTHLRVMNNSNNYAENSMSNPLLVSPKEVELSAENGLLNYNVPAYSLNVLTIPLENVSAEQTLEPASTIPTPVISYDFEGEDETANGVQLMGGATILELDGDEISVDHALYTGADEANGWADLGTEAAQQIGGVMATSTYSVSTNIMIQNAAHFDQYCWAWTLNNGVSRYVGLINQPNNLNWYFEQVNDGTTKASSHSGLSQNEWHNITVTSSKEAVCIYVDGQLRNTKMPEAKAFTGITGTKAWLARSPFANDAYMTGVWLDDVAFYDKTLSAAEVLALYNQSQQKSTHCSDLDELLDPEENEDAEELIGDRTNVDITSLLVNADFAKGDEGWEGTPLSAAPGTVAEHFYQLFDTYQLLKNMPAGEYRLEWQGFYRNGDIANAYLRHQKGTEEMAEVYVNEVSVEMLSLFDASVPYTYDPYTYPDNVNTANTAFQAGRYQQSLTYELKEKGHLRIGLRKFTPCVYDWACFDNFRLIYVGKNTDGVEEIAVEKSGNDKWYDLQGRAVNKPGRGIYIKDGKKIVVR
ncbi:MAG: carbohydrate binding domain-containing protein [Prevotella sp.]|nr:carbohydrate binding domain-containing protein [Prevotella sp.]